METIQYAEGTPRDFVLEEGLLLRAGPTVFRLVRLHQEVATLQHTVSLEQKAILVSQLLAEYTKGRVILADDSDEKRALEGDSFEEDDKTILAELPLADLSEAQIQHVLRVSRYIRGLRGLGYQSLCPVNQTIRLDLNRLQRRFADPKPVKAEWIYRWSLRLEQANGDPRALIPQFGKRGGKGKTRVEPEIADALKVVLDRKKAKASLAVRTREVLEEVKSYLEITHPNRPDLIIGLNWSLIDRHIKNEFSAYDLCCRNYGKAYANKKYRDWYPRDTAGSPLAVFETDDTDTCVFNIDRLSGLPCGRAYLTGVIDQNSLVVPGLEISHKPRSTWSAISALINAILPKDPSHPDLAESKAGCEFYGKPGVVVFDNALYNHADEIEETATSIGFIPGWAKPKTPTEKAHQEGWNGRVKDEFLPTLPGYRGDKKQREGLQEGVAAANMDLQTFRQFLMKWIYDVYSNQPLADGLTPRQKWHLGTRFSKPRIPRDIWGYKLVPCLHKTLKFRPEGILFCGLIYSVPFLQVLRKRYGHNAEAKFRFNPGDLKEIYVQDPATKAYTPVPSTDLAYTTGLSLYQHKLICKMARENKIRNPSIPQLLLYREELRVLTEQLRYSTKLKDRKQSARTGEVPAGDSPPPTSPQKPGSTVVTLLEDRILEIEEVEMDEEDEGWNLPIVD